jgi:hypothetical protein
MIVLRIRRDDEAPQMICHGGCIGDGQREEALWHRDLPAILAAPAQCSAQCVRQRAFLLGRGWRSASGKIESAIAAAPRGRRVFETYAAATGEAFVHQLRSMASARCNMAK